MLKCGFSNFCVNPGMYVHDWDEWYDSIGMKIRMGMQKFEYRCECHIHTRGRCCRLVELADFVRDVVENNKGKGEGYV